MLAGLNYSAARPTGQRLRGRRVPWPNHVPWCALHPFALSIPAGRRLSAAAQPTPSSELTRPFASRSGDYPFKPPDIKLFTPSGRFKPETKICTSMTSFHPSTWNPAWSVATILTGLLSFMLSEEITTGSMTATAADRKLLAEKSHTFNIGNKKFRDNFPDVSPATPRAAGVETALTAAAPPRSTPARR